VPLRAIHPARGWENIKRLVQFAGGVIFGAGVAHQLDARVEGDNRLRVAPLDRVGVDAGDRFVELDMLVAAIEPPTRDLVAVACRPFVNDLGPLVREILVDRLVLSPLRQPERPLGTTVSVRCLARQIQHQPDTLGLQRAVEIQRQVAAGTLFTRRGTDDPVIHRIRRVEEARVLAQGEDEVGRSHRLQLPRQRWHVEILYLGQALGVSRQEVHEDTEACILQPVRSAGNVRRVGARRGRRKNTGQAHRQCGPGGSFQELATVEGWHRWFVSHVRWSLVDMATAASRSFHIGVISVLSVSAFVHGRPVLTPPKRG